jgi:hypothetical protein
MRDGQSPARALAFTFFLLPLFIRDVAGELLALLGEFGENSDL